ncbi:hypothetical protein CR513_23884, partial [Mucuna pruriens]
MSPLLEYLRNDQLPDKEKSTYIIQVVHESVCGTLIGDHALASKIFRASYYWPTLKHDCIEYVRKCDKCQRFAEACKALPKRLHLVISPWPFYNWGVDILGPFPMAPEQIKFFIVVVDYFTKWVEAESVTTIFVERIKRSFGRRSFVVLAYQPKSYRTTGCSSHPSLRSSSAKKHPQSNGQAEAANKKRLEEAKGRWVEELPHVLWSYHTTPQSTTNETPFRLTFGTEAVIPVEIGESSP